MHRCQSRVLRRVETLLRHWFEAANSEESGRKICARLVLLHRPHLREKHFRPRPGLHEKRLAHQPQTLETFRRTHRREHTAPARSFARARRRIETEVEPERRPGERERLNALAAFVEAADCRRAILLRHFGEEPPAHCGNCDNCLEPPQGVDATEIARKLLSAAFRTEMRFGVAHLAAVLGGDDNEKVRQFGHHKLSVFGIATAEELALVRGVARALIARDALRADAYGGLSFGPNAKPILKGEEEVRIALPPKRQRARRSRDSGPAATPAPPAERRAARPAPVHVS